LDSLKERRRKKSYESKNKKLPSIERKKNLLQRRSNGELVPKGCHTGDSGLRIKRKNQDALDKQLTSKRK